MSYARMSPHEGFSVRAAIDVAAPLMPRNAEFPSYRPMDRTKSGSSREATCIVLPVQRRVPRAPLETNGLHPGGVGPWAVAGVALTILHHVTSLGYTVSVFRIPSSLAGDAAGLGRDARAGSVGRPPDEACGADGRG